VEVSNSGETRALQILSRQLGESQARAMLDSLRAAGIRLADEQTDELVCRWVDVLERPVPPDADTIIRTITRTFDGRASSTTHWLDGLRAPHQPALAVG
jgi:hypothetical protein